MGIESGLETPVEASPEESMDKPQSQEKPKPEIMDFNPEIENAFIEKAKAGIDKFVAEGGNTILFDWDGTIRGNNFEQGVSNYIRRGFVETYQYARAQGLRIGVCSLRSIAEIENLEHLGITFDEYNGADSMKAFIAEHPSMFHEAALEFQKLAREEMVKVGTEVIGKIQAGERPEGWEVLLQAAGEMQANNPQYPNMKNLFMAHRLATGEKVFLIDDDEASGSTAERFGVGVQIPRPAGYKHDNKTLS